MKSTKVNYFRYLLFLLLASTAFGEGVPFTISSKELPPPEEAKAAPGKKGAPVTPTPNAEDETEGSGSNDLTSRLKHQAVINYLQGHLGARYSKYEEKITSAFAEKYILEYKISRPANEKNVVILSGSIDSDSLKRWLRKFEIKSSGASGLSPLFFVSAEPGPMRAAESATAVKSGISETVFGQLQIYMSRFNATMVPFSGAIGLNAPPRTESEIRTLAESGQSRNANSAVWIHFSQCPSCGGSRVDLLFYYFPQNRLALGKAEDLPFDFREGATTERSKKAVKAATDEFGTGLTELIEQGTLFSSVHTLAVDGLDSLRAFKQLDNGLSRLDFVTRVVLKKTEPTRVEYEVLSGLSSEELMQRLQNNAFAGFKLKAAGYSGSSLQMRYGRGT